MCGTGAPFCPCPRGAPLAQDAVTRLQPAVLNLAARPVPFAAQHPLAPAGAGPVQFFDLSFCCWIATFLHLLPFVSAYFCLRLKPTHLLGRAHWRRGWARQVGGRGSVDCMFSAQYLTAPVSKQHCCRRLREFKGGAVLSRRDSPAWLSSLPTGRECAAPGAHLISLKFCTRGVACVCCTAL